MEVGRWDPGQTLIVFNDASAERDRLCGLATARIGGGTDGQNDLAAAMTDVSPRSIAAAVRRKQKQKEQSKEQQQQQQQLAAQVETVRRSRHPPPAGGRQLTVAPEVALIACRSRPVVWRRGQDRPS